MCRVSDAQCYDSSPIYTYFLTLLTYDAPPESKGVPGENLLIPGRFFLSLKSEDLLELYSVT